MDSYGKPWNIWERMPPEKWVRRIRKAHTHTYTYLEFPSQGATYLKGFMLFDPAKVNILYLIRFVMSEFSIFKQSYSDTSEKNHLNFTLFFVGFTQDTSLRPLFLWRVRLSHGLLGRHPGLLQLDVVVQATGPHGGPNGGATIVGVPLDRWMVGVP